MSYKDSVLYRLSRLTIGHDGYDAIVSDAISLVDGLAQKHDHLADEVASVLVQLDELAATWGDEAVFRRCRDRLRAALKQARGEVTCERNGNNAS